MAVLVTGGAGFIGSNLVEKLLELQHRVIVVDDFSLGKEENLPRNNNLLIHKKSIGDPNLFSLIKNESIETIFHLAALPRVQFSIQHPQETHEANVNGTLNLLQICKDLGIKRFIFSSSSAIYGDQDTLPLVEEMKPNPMSPYALHKLIGEHYCKLYNLLYRLETISLRYFNVYGRRQNPEGNYANLIPRSIMLFQKNQSPTIFGDGNQTRDFTFVSDVVEANILAASAHNSACFGEVFNIGSGRNISVNQVIHEIKKVSKSEKDPVYALPVVEPRDTLADISKAKKLLAWEPKVPFEKGLEETYQYFSQKEPEE